MEVIFDNRKSLQKGDVVNVVYSDTLALNDLEKVRELSAKHFADSGDCYDGRTPEQIEAFLSEFFSESIMLIGVVKDVNRATGYDVWIFLYTKKNNK